MSSGTPSHDALSELKALSKIIEEFIASIESTLSPLNLEFPSPHTPPTPESEAPRMIPEVKRACNFIVAAATQLVYAARSPFESVVAVATSHAFPAALGIAVEANAPEVCREAGPQGAHVRDIAQASNIDPSKLARALRVLANNHIFVEVAPDVFANNRISASMDTGKAVTDLVANPDSKHVGTIGNAAGIGHCTDEAMKASSFLQDTLFDRQLASSQEPNETAFNMAFKTKLPIFEWFEEKANEARRLRFGIAMAGAKHAASPTAILEGFDWKSLAGNSIVVDVGGGIGAQSLTLAQNYEHLQFVVQDRAEITKDAKEFWSAHMPDAVKSGRVVLQEHDFFTEQPVKDAAIFLLRNILHDWSDSYCLTILRRLRDAAAKTTRLMIVDNLISYACVDNELGTIRGAEKSLPPAPLLPNGGHSATIAYFQDIQIMALANGKERAITQIRQLMAQTGWLLVQVHHAAGFSTQKAIAIPV